MTQTDDAINRVLAGLGDVEAPSGMEQRVLARMAAQGEMRRPGLGWVMACGAVAAGVAAVAMLMLTRPAVQSAPAVAIATPAAIPAAMPAAMPAAKVVSVRRESGGANHHRVAPRAQEAAVNPEARGGMPPPPMPLTAEEKLLLQAVQQGHAADLALLNPEVRAEQEAENDAEFAGFFAKHMTDESQTATSENEQGETR